MSYVKQKFTPARKPVIRVGMSDPYCPFAKLDDPDLSGFFPQRVIEDDERHVQREFYPWPSELYIETRATRADEVALIEKEARREAARRKETEEEKREYRRLEQRYRRAAKKAARTRMERRIRERHEDIVKSRLPPRKPDEKWTAVNRSKGAQILAALERNGYVRVETGRFEQKRFKCPIRAIHFFNHAQLEDVMWLQTYFSRTTA